MTIKVAINDGLLKEAMELGNHRNKEGAVNKALQGYVVRLLRRKYIRLFGTFDFDPRHSDKKTSATR